MEIRNIRRDEIHQYCRILPEEKGTLEPLLISWLDEGVSTLEQCFILEENQKPLGRVIYGVYDGSIEILDLTLVKDFQEAAGEVLLSQSLKKVVDQGFQRVGCHLYSDKEDFQRYVDLLHQLGFQTIQEKKSYVWNQGKIRSQQEGLTYRSLEAVGMEAFIQGIEAVTEGTLDQEDRLSIEEMGATEAAKHYFETLKAIDYRPQWWKLAYVEDQLAGLIIPQQFDEAIGAINYIGVVPSFRGRGYSLELLAEGVRQLHQAGVKRIIADIDVANFPLDKALQENDFQMDCSMQVLRWEAVK